MKDVQKYLFAGFLFAFLSINIFAQQISVKTNGLMLGAGLPNIGTELVIGKKVSFELSAFAGYHPYKLDVVTAGVMPEIKYWFSGRVLTRTYLGFSLLANSYKINWSGRRLEGDALGAGLTFGYSIPLSAHWNIDFSAGVGTVYFRQRDYDKTVINENSGINSKGVKLMPTKLAISIAYIIK